jgi:hypothetical protein
LRECCFSTLTFAQCGKVEAVHARPYVVDFAPKTMSAPEVFDEVRLSSLFFPFLSLPPN